VEDIRNEFKEQASNLNENYLFMQGEVHDLIAFK